MYQQVFSFADPITGDVTGFAMSNWAIYFLIGFGALVVLAGAVQIVRYVCELCVVFFHCCSLSVVALRKIWGFTIPLYARYKAWRARVRVCEKEEESEKLIDLRQTDGVVRYENGVTYLDAVVDGSRYYLPFAQVTKAQEPTKPLAEQEKATLSLVCPMTCESYKRFARGSASFLVRQAGADRLVGQACLILVPGSVQRRVLITTAHEWKLLAAAFEMEATSVVLRGPGGLAAVLDRATVKVASMDGDGDGKGFDLVALRLPMTVYSTVGLSAYTVARMRMSMSPLLYYVEAGGACKSCPSTVWRRSEIGKRLHNASTLPGSSGAALLMPGGKIVGMHVGATELDQLNEAVDLTVLFPPVPAQESEYPRGDEVQLDPEADVTRPKKYFSDVLSPMTYFEDVQGRIGITSRASFVSSRGVNWADVVDSDDEDDWSLEQYDFNSKEAWAARNAHDEDVAAALAGGDLRHDVDLIAEGQSVVQESGVTAEQLASACSTDLSSRQKKRKGKKAKPQVEAPAPVHVVIQANKSGARDELLQMLDEAFEAGDMAQAKKISDLLTKCNKMERTKRKGSSVLVKHLVVPESQDFQQNSQAQSQA